MQEAKWIKFFSSSIFKFQDGEKLFKNIIGKQIINCWGSVKCQHQGVVMVSIPSSLSSLHQTSLYPVI